MKALSAGDRFEEVMADDRQAITAGPWPQHYTCVPAMRVGNMVWLAGTTGTDDQGRITAPGGIVEQTRQIFRKFQRLLESVGGSVPTSTGVLVAGLLRKDALIEISGIAVLRR